MNPRAMFNSVLALSLAIPCLLRPTALGQDYRLHVHSIESQELKDAVKACTANARIVGLGECTHFTKECYLLKREIIAALMESGFRGLALEVDFGQALIWDDFVTNGNGDLDTIVAESGWFTYRTDEFKSVLKMLREHNASAKQPFRIFGMEMTAVNHNTAWLSTFIKKSGIEDDSLHELLASSAPTVAFEQHSFEQASHYWKLSHRTSNFLKEHETQLMESCGESDLRIAVRMAEIFRQYATYVSHADNSLKLEFRDQFSARNVHWCLETLGPESKLIVWAHNGHITQDALANYDVLGNHLSRWFGDVYFAIGFTMGHGEFGAFASDGFRRWKIEATQEASVTLELSRLGAPYVFANIRQGLEQDPRIDSPLRQDRFIQRDSGESFSSEWPQLVRINLSQAYDALIYIDESSFPSPIEWKRPGNSN